MRDEYQITLKELRRLSARIDDSLPKEDDVARVTNLQPRLTGQPQLVEVAQPKLSTLRNYVSGFDRRVQRTGILHVPEGPVEVENVAGLRIDDTQMLLPRHDNDSGITFDKRWRNLASVYYLPSKYAIGYLCIPSSSSGSSDTVRQVGKDVIDQVFENAMDLSITLETTMVLGIASTIGFNQECQELVMGSFESGGWTHPNVSICLINLSSAGGFIVPCNPLDRWSVAALRYFLPDLLASELNQVREETKKLVPREGGPIGNADVQKILGNALNYVDMAFVQLTEWDNFEMGYTELGGPSLRRST